MRTYKVVLTNEAERNLKKLDNQVAISILKYIRKNLADDNNPRRLGIPLVGDHSGEWRYRVGDYRIICEIDDTEIIILVIKVGHRKNIYKES